MAIRIAINGFGRIGRQITRLLSAGYGAGVELVAVNSLEPIDLAAHLLRYDSNHGIFSESVTVRGQELIVGDERAIRFDRQSDPGYLPWGELGIDLVLECSGQCTERAAASRHLEAGASRVLITAAAHNPDATLCMGVNHGAYQPGQHYIVSGSSCTTNCLAPAVKVLHDSFDIQTCLATFLHSYTSSQPLLDRPGHDLRRMRGVEGNIIPTSTSSVQQIPEVMPELTGRFDAIAIRVPTPQVHLAALTASLAQPVSAQQVLDACRAAGDKALHGILAVSDAPLVSIDYKGSSPSCIIDAGTVQVVGDMLQLMIWHDNESSYCKRMLDLVRYMAVA